MDKILEMKQKRAAIIAQARAILDKAENEKRSITEDEDKQYTDLVGQAERMQKDIEREERQLELERQAGESQRSPGAQPQPQRQAPNVIADGIKDELEPGIRLARYAKSILNSRNTHEAPEAVAKRMYPKDPILHESFSSRAMSTQTPSEGGAIVPENLSNEIIPLLRQAGIVRTLGATSVPIPNGNMTMPRQTGAANFQWIGENKPITASQPTLGQLKLSAKKLAGLIPLSNEMIRNASLSADQFVRNEIVNGIAESEDITSLYGTGTAYTPIGVFNHPDVNKSALNKIPTSDDLAIIVGLLMVQKFGRLVSPAWRFSGALWSLLYNLKDGTGNYVHRTEMDQGKLVGFPFKVDNNVTFNAGATHADTEIYFGDWSHFLLGDQMSLEIKASEEATYNDGGTLVSAFNNDQTVMRAIQMEDFNIRYGSAFVVRTGVYTK